MTARLHTHLFKAAVTVDVAVPDDSTALTSLVHESYTSDTFYATLQFLDSQCIEVDPCVYVVQLTDGKHYINAFLVEKEWKRRAVYINSWIVRFIAYAKAGSVWQLDMAVQR